MADNNIKAESIQAKTGEVLHVRSKARYSEFFTLDDPLDLVYKAWVTDYLENSTSGDIYSFKHLLPAGVNTITGAELDLDLSGLFVATAFLSGINISNDTSGVPEQNQLIYTDDNGGTFAVADEDVPDGEEPTDRYLVVLLQSIPGDPESNLALKGLLDGKQTIPVISSSIASAKKLGNTYYGIIDQYNGEEFTGNVATTLPGGATITDADVDNIVIFKRGTDYIKRNIPYDFVSPLIFGCVGDGDTDDTENFAKCIDYCISYKKSLYVNSLYTFAITSIVRSVSSNNGFTMFGDGIQSKIKVINTTNEPGIKITVAGSFRTVVIRDFKIDGNALCGNGLHVVRAVRPSVVSGITGEGFTNTGASHIVLQDCIDLKCRDTYARGVNRGITLLGQCDAVELNNNTVYDFIEYALCSVSAIETVTGIMENSIGIKIYEPYCYGTGTVSDDVTGKTAIYLEDPDRSTLYGGWFENVEFAMQALRGSKSRGFFEGAIYNPRRGGSGIPKIILESAVRARVDSPSIPVEVDVSSNSGYYFGNGITEATPGLNSIFSHTQSVLNNPVTMLDTLSVAGKIAPIINSGHYANKPVIADDGVYSFTPDEANGTILIMALTSNNYGMFQYRAASTPITNKISGSASFVAMASTALTGTSGVDGNFTVSAHTDGKIYIENRNGASRSMKVTVL